MGEIKASRNGRINIVLQNNAQVQAMHAKNTIHPVNKQFAEIDKVFSSFVAMNEIKKTVKQIYATMIVNKKREEYGISANKQVLHMMFKGNPGTGKTSVARKLAKLYAELGILSKGHFIEAERADLVGEYIGQTAQKTRAILQKAAGGILFIDEAYSLARGGEKDFGKEAIDTLVKHMEDHHNDLVLILAGYSNEMNRFLTMNPGLESRFPFILEFPDYKLDDLMEIARRMISEREYRLSKEAELKLRNELYKNILLKKQNFSNARNVRNIIEKAIRHHAYRLVQTTNYHPERLIELTAEDISIK